jgi:hypothetical protein
MMDGCRKMMRSAVALMAMTLAALIPTAVQAQGGFGGGGFGGGGFGGGGAVGGNFQNAGVVIDAQGVVRVQRLPDPGGVHAKRIVEAARASLNPDLVRQSPLRKISLNRLEQVVARQIAIGQGPSDEMKYLAGLLRIHYVFFYPETGDIVLAGPAEGFAADPVGRVRGMSSGRPVLELQDLVTALRAYPPDGNQVNVIGVSIDPTSEGLDRMRQFYASIAGRVGPGDAAAIAKGMRDSLGLQTVTVQGISPQTHFAQVLVEADYRMKLIGIGLEEPPVKIRTWISQANPRSVARNALQRWYFTPDYECIRESEDGLAMQMEGWGVKLVGEAELVQEGGVRVQAGGENKASEMFCRSFTEKYPQLADREPVYAQLRNLIDLSVAAAFIQEKDYYHQANWDLGVFAHEEQFPVETYETPRQVESAVNVVWRGNTLMTPIGGGVNVQPRLALQSQHLLSDDDGSVRQARDQVSLRNLPDGQWWWD